ncbi:MAG TPA: aminotransferase class I/II-fold pyridoxal phosphate-dependent enzyme [Planctomycetaceae bacterium]|nr:aminotransferase class I/II-fold pyridoxal phosphate-dependent enzyme [Planctomycetaceae bacterium]
MRDLLEHPLWRPEDLGAPIPDSPHAVSACLPTWRDNVGYEEHDPRVHSRLTTGYPRFVYNAFCRRLFDECRRRFARDDESCLAVPSAGVAERCARWLRDRTGSPTGVRAWGAHDVHAVTFPAVAADEARAWWQHTGDGVSSRLAEACLDGRSAVDASAVRDALRSRIAEAAGVTSEDVFLFSCGMTAACAVHRALTDLCPGRKSVQFGFPYVDTLKIQEKFGPGAHFFPCGDADELAQLAALIRTERVGGLWTEFPSNPLLASPDLERLATLARRHEAPLIVDDTIAGWPNVDVLQAADVVTTSLTKSFSGVGDVTGGAVVVNPRSAFGGEIASALRRGWEDLLWGEDAIVLERNSCDFAPRVLSMSAGAETLAEWLSRHPRVAEVSYPSLRTAAEYRAFQRAGGGFGSLLSIVLHDAPRTTPAFFDALRVSKGPNLGTSYTLACPYTILAHYRELEFAERCGVSRWLVRVSVGLESPEDLIARFDAALSATP